MPFGQLVIGPPGSGKSTYCNGMQQFLSAIGRKTSVINLDPANDRISYPCALDIRDFTRLEDIMSELNLGPNGGIMYALEEVENSLDDFVNMIESLGKQDYLIFDCPGQVELLLIIQPCNRSLKARKNGLPFSRNSPRRFILYHISFSVHFYFTVSTPQYASARSASHQCA